MSRFLKTFVLSVLLVTAFSSYAVLDFLQPYQGPGKDVVTLVITGNYRVPRLLADLIQHESRQPYMLLPAVQDVDQNTLYFCPVNPKKTALQVKKEDFARFIRFVNPDKVVVLGDTSYVAKEYLDAISPNIPVITVTGDWNRAAATLGTTLNLSNLKGDFAYLYAKLEKTDGLYVPETAPTKVTEITSRPAVVENVASETEPENTPVESEVDVMVVEETAGESVDETAAAVEPAA